MPLPFPSPLAPLLLSLSLSPQIPSPSCPSQTQLHFPPFLPFPPSPQPTIFFFCVCQGNEGSLPTGTETTLLS
ncbi:MAG: hypothetical protein J3Q66DRAFT_342060 [Benniella sp.]|nr:MAG: hypothetical protein J3Q66DRAFT_342060 [Benniella sp.]